MNLIQEPIAIAIVNLVHASRILKDDQNLRAAGITSETTVLVSVGLRHVPLYNAQRPLGGFDGNFTAKDCLPSIEQTPTGLSAFWSTMYMLVRETL